MLSFAVFWHMAVSIQAACLQLGMVLGMVLEMVLGMVLKRPRMRPQHQLRATHWSKRKQTRLQQWLYAKVCVL